MRRLLLQRACACFVVVWATALAAFGQRTNVLLLVADDLGVDKVGVYEPCTDPPAPLTPRIDALARSGLLFRRAYAYPLCSPARACLQSGRYGFRTGIGANVFEGREVAEPVRLRPEEVTIAEMLDRGQSGYGHALFGKWHLGYHDRLGVAGDPQNQGYEHFVGTDSNFDRRADPPRNYAAWDKTVNGVTELCREYNTAVLVDEALEWMVAQGERPFVSIVAFHSPHTPLQRPPGAALPHELPRPAEAWWPYHDAMIESLDAEIGRLLDSFEARAPESFGRTLILFCGDNGTARTSGKNRNLIFPPFDRRKGKGTVYEGGIHVPLIATGHGVGERARGRATDALVSFVDFFATIAAIAGVDLDDPRVWPEGRALDSLSFLPLLDDPEAAAPRRFVYAEMFKPNGPPDPALEGTRALLGGRYKIVWRPRRAPPRDFELFDLALDPHEQTDLLHPQRIRALGPARTEEFRELQAAMFQLLGL